MPQFLPGHLCPLSGWVKSETDQEASAGMILPYLRPFQYPRGSMGSQGKAPRFAPLTTHLISYIYWDREKSFTASHWFSAIYWGGKDGCRFAAVFRPKNRSISIVFRN
jgi:hypothetical protein